MDIEPAQLPFIGKRSGPKVPSACESTFNCFSLLTRERKQTERQVGDSQAAVESYLASRCF